jgi:hypothetical protein
MDNLLVGVNGALSWIVDKDLVHRSVIEIHKAVEQQKLILDSNEEDYGQKKKNMRRRTMVRVRDFYEVHASRYPTTTDCPSTDHVRCKYPKQLGAPEGVECPTMAPIPAPSETGPSATDPLPTQ